MDLFWKIIFVIFFGYALTLGAMSFVMYWGMKLRELEEKMQKAEHNRKLSGKSALERVFGGRQ